MRRQRRTKIVATLGPASGDRTTIGRLFAAGADVFRINMSHTNHERMRELVTAIRSIEAEHNRPVGILVDLQGPKLRLGSFAEGSVQLNNGQSFALDSDKAPGDNSRARIPATRGNATAVSFVNRASVKQPTCASSDFRLRVSIQRRSEMFTW